MRKRITRIKLATLTYVNSPDIPKAVVVLRPRRMEWVGIGWVDCGEPQGDEVIVDDRMPPSDLSAEQYEALLAFRAVHGRNWKAPLRHAWETGDYAGFNDPGPLQQIRNSFGPSWLVRFRFPK